MRTEILAASVIALIPWVAHAQPAPAPAAPPPLQEGTAEFSFVGTTGNSSTQSIGLGGEYIYRPDPWTISTKAAYVRNHAESELKAESFALGISAARALTPRVSVFARYGYLHDLFAGIEQRQTGEGGVAYVLVDAAPHKLVGDVALGYAHESRALAPALSNATFGAGALYTFKLSQTAEVSEDARTMFSLAEGSDWRFANVASVTAKLTTVLSLKLSNTIRFVHSPAPGFETTDTITAMTLVAKF